MDNYAAHKHAKVKAWLAANPRIHIHFTPTHASWMNMVECWFSLAERQAIRRGTYTSVKDLNAKIRAYIDAASASPAAAHGQDDGLLRARAPRTLDLTRRRLQAGATLQQVAKEFADLAPVLPGPADDQLLLSTQRARLIEAGRAIFLQSGFDTVSVEEVVERAGVGKAAFYRHFAGERDLLAACLASELDWYEATTGQDGPSQDRLLRFSAFFRHRRFRALFSLFALLRQTDVYQYQLANVSGPFDS
jgi:hypothetical protein